MKLETLELVQRIGRERDDLKNNLDKIDRRISGWHFSVKVLHSKGGYSDEVHLPVSKETAEMIQRCAVTDLKLKIKALELQLENL